MSACKRCLHSHKKGILIEGYIEAILNIGYCNCVIGKKLKAKEKLESILTGKHIIQYTYPFPKCTNCGNGLHSPGIVGVSTEIFKNINTQKTAIHCKCIAGKWLESENISNNTLSIK